jgi:hypothetical protein
MQLRSTHLLVIAGIALLLLAVAGVVYMDQREQARAQRAKAGERARSATSGPSGRERCMQKCAAVHKGYIYRAEQRVEDAGRSRIVPEACRCLGREVK